MPNELEQQLSAALRRPRPTKEATTRARAASLATLPPGRRRTAGWILALAAMVIAAVVGLGAAALAATGKLHVVLGAPRVAHPAPTDLTLPSHTNGIALVAGGKLWLATRRGLRIEGMPVSAAELSPRALYAVVGLGSSLVALAPGRRHAWTRKTGGRVVTASWAPDGLEIAYIVQVRSGTELRVIEGDGDHDRLLARHVVPLKPIWRRDSLALTYFRPRRTITLDFKHGTRQSGVRHRSRLPARAVSPLGDAVAIATRRGRRFVELRVQSDGRTGSRVLLRVRAARGPVSVSWR
jgi:hypothetical protein